jgi:hypothetical protein
MTFNGRLLAFVAALSSACGQILGAEGNAWRDVIKWTAHHDGTGSEGMGHGQFLRDALEELELMTCECADHAELNEVLHAHRPDLGCDWPISGRRRRHGGAEHACNQRVYRQGSSTWSSQFTSAVRSPAPRLSSR